MPSRFFSKWFSKSNAKTTPTRERLAIEPLEDRLAPATLTVNSIADDTTSNSTLTLREAIQLINSAGNANAALGRALTAGEQSQVTGTFGNNDTIAFSSALNNQTITLGSLLPDLATPLSISGPGEELLAIDGNDQFRIFEVPSTGNLSLSDVTIQNGRLTGLGNGGGIRNNGTLSLNNVTVTGCDVADDAGALFSTANAISTTITNSTFTNNTAGNSGGAILVNSNLTISGSTFSNNTATNFSGGAIYVGNGTTNIDTTTITNNSAGNYGGGIRTESIAFLTITSSTISDNQAFQTGGGIYSAGEMTVSQSTIRNNTSEGGGGGLYTDAPASIDRSTISGNIAQDGSGGGFYHDTGTLVITNSTISGNTASLRGGGVRNDATLVVLNSTITLNAADSDNDSTDGTEVGGGIHTTDTQSTKLFNTIVAGNFIDGTVITDPNIDSDDIGGANVDLAVSANNLISDPVFNGGLTHGNLGNIVGDGQGDLLFIDTVLDMSLQDNGGPTFTHLLVPGSPAINAGANSPANLPSGVTMPTVDQIGVARIAGGTVDIGAVESDSAAPTITNIDDGVFSNLGLVNAALTYRIRFNEVIDFSSISASVFVNAGTASISIGAISQINGRNITVVVTPTSTGTLQLRIPTGAVITDPFGNALAVPRTDDETLTVVPAFTGALIVDTTSDVADGDFSAGKLSLREAITIANLRAGADTITFASALYQQTITMTGGRYVITSPITITGLGTRNLTIDGNDASQIFFIDGDAAVNVVVLIQDVTLTRGRSSVTGVVRDGYETGLSGGAINNLRADLTLDRVAITNSHVSDSTPESSGGGALMNWIGDSTLTVKNSTLSGNTATGDGGAIYSWGNTFVIVNSTISGNSAKRFGGGIAHEIGALEITNTTITLNGADSDNSSPGDAAGGGVYRFLTGTIRLFNTIVAGNFRGAATLDFDNPDPNLVGDDIVGAVDAASSNNLVSEPTAAGGMTNGTNGNIIGDPSNTLDGQRRYITDILDVVLQDNGGPTNTHALVQNSFAIGGGSTTVTGYSKIDQRSTPRDLTDPDIGAYEVQHPLAPVGVPATYAETFLPKGSPDTNTAFVRGLYTSTLLREADADGLAFWVGFLNAGNSLSTVAFGFVNSDENRGNQIRFYYRYFLGREADNNEVFNVWVPVIKSSDEGSVMTSFALSDEFSGQNNDDSFVNLMYYALLGRQAETQGFNDWITSLNQGASREVVVTAFLRSDESIFRIVDSLFSSYLKRPADAANRTGFHSSIKNGTSFGAAAAQILGSTEFYDAAEENR